MSQEAFKLFCPYQIAWMRDPAGVRLAEKSRRIGWTYADAFDAVISRVGTHPAKPFDCWYSATDMSAAEEYVGYISEFLGMVSRVAKVMDDVIEVAGDEAGSKEKINVKRVTLDNGLRITAGSSNPKFFRSKGGEVKLDELAFHDRAREMYKAAHASARFWRMPLAAWSSHHGPGSYFNFLITKAREGKLRASLHRVTILDAVEQGICERIRMRAERLADLPAIDLAYRQEWLDGLRAECPDEDVWNEEYLCIPSSDQSSLLSYDLLRACEVANLQLAKGATGGGGALYAGFDVGRKHDLSVLWVLEKVGDVFWTRVLRTFANESFSVQEGALNQLLAAGGVKRLCIDSTGIGMQMSERLQERWGAYRVEAVNFTAPVKSELAMPLRRLFEDRLVRVPMDDAVREDLHKVRKIVTAAGNVRFDAQHDESGHADRFWALALAYHAADDNKRPLPPPLAEKPEVLI